MVIELFPFGRKKFAAELLPLLERARAARGPRPLVVCSLRDILVSRGERQRRHDERAAATANRWFDLVLVHADPDFARLEDSFDPRTTAARAGPLHRVRRRGRSAAAPRAAAHRPRAGLGGRWPGWRAAAAGRDRRPRAARDTATDAADRAGPCSPPTAGRSSSAAPPATPGSSSCARSPDLGAELREASASVSQCGYNTALEVVRSRRACARSPVRRRRRGRADPTCRATGDAGRDPRARSAAPRRGGAGGRHRRPRRLLPRRCRPRPRRRARPRPRSSRGRSRRRRPRELALGPAQRPRPGTPPGRVLHPRRRRRLGRREAAGVGRPDRRAMPAA